VPLLKGITKKSFRENLRRLRHDGYPQKVAAGIAYGIVRKSARDQGVKRPSWVKAEAPKKKPRKGKRKGAMRSARRWGASMKSMVVTPRITRLKVKRGKSKAKAKKKRR
jgi:hypothetical protein